MDYFCRNPLTNSGIKKTAAQVAGSQRVKVFTTGSIVSGPGPTVHLTVLMLAKALTLLAPTHLELAPAASVHVVRKINKTLIIINN
jgi:hypothetical protein